MKQNRIIEIQAEIETRCALTCKHCSTKHRRATSATTNIVGDIARLVEQSDLNYSIQLTGGEPLYSKNITKTISTLNNANKITTIGLFTSGISFFHNKHMSISIDEAHELKEAGLKTCYVSIYSDIPSIHDKITGLPNSHALTIKSTKALTLANIETKAHIVLNKYNIEKIDEIIDFLSSIGFSESRILRIVKTGEATKNWTDIGVSYNTQKDIIKKLSYKCNMLQHPVTISGYPEFMACRPQHGAIGCEAGSKILYVTFNGDVYPCACTQNIPSMKISTISETRHIHDYLINNAGKHKKLCINPPHD